MVYVTMLTANQSSAHKDTILSPVLQIPFMLTKLLCAAAVQDVSSPKVRFIDSIYKSSNPNFDLTSGPDESCTGSESAFDLTNFYTEMRYLSTGQAPLVKSEKCAPGLSCERDTCQAKGNELSF